MVAPMKLQTYLENHKLSHADFAALLGVSEFGVRKWAREERMPRRKALRRIQEVTGGQVTPADFVGAAA